MRKIAVLVDAARRSGGKIALLPEGEARIERLAERDLESPGQRTHVAMYAITGLDFPPVQRSDTSARHGKPVSTIVHTDDRTGRAVMYTIGWKVFAYVLLLTRVSVKEISISMCGFAYREPYQVNPDTAS